MAQTPRGQARSVFGQIRSAADEMVEQERLKRERAKALQGLAAQSVATHDPRAGLLNYDPRRDITPAGQVSVVRPDKPPVSPAELEARRRGIERALFMANNPLAGGAYGIASAMNAPQGVRDAALAVGGLLDAGLTGAAPMGAILKPRPSAPLARAHLPIRRDPVREVNSLGQATGVNKIETPEMLGTGSRANQRLPLPGWSGNGNKSKEDRAHVDPRELGGSGRRAKDLTTASRSINRGIMREFDRRVAERVRAGEVVDYSNTPFYGSSTGAPEAYLMTVNGPIGGPKALFIGNPAGRRK